MFGLLFPVSDVTWQISAHPVLIHHSSLALFICHLLKTFFTQVPTVMHFYSYIHNIKNTGFEVLSKSVASLNSPYLFLEGEVLSRVK